MKGGEMRSWQRSLIGAGLGAALVPIVLPMSVKPTRAPSPGRVAVKEPAATRWASGPSVGRRREPRAGASPEELELLGFQVEIERDQLRLTESRLEQARRWEDRAKELSHYGHVPIEQLIVAQDGVLMRRSDAAAQKTAFKAAELRLAQVQQGISSDWSASSPSERRLAELERRLAALEGAVRKLRQEMESAKLDLPIDTSSGRR
jgi:hypothetical protein